MEGPDKLFDRDTNIPTGWGREANGMVDSPSIEAGVVVFPGLQGEA